MATFVYAHRRSRVNRCLLYQLLTGRPPVWDRSSEIWDRLLGQFPMEIVEGASSTHATIRSYLKCRYQHVGLKKYISSISTSRMVSHMNIIVVHPKGQNWSTPKRQYVQPEKSCDHRPPVSKIYKNDICICIVFAHLYICRSMWTINNEYNAYYCCVSLAIVVAYY